MKFLSKLLVAMSVALSLVGVAYAEKLKVGATPVQPHKCCACRASRSGNRAKVVEFTDYVLPNGAVIKSV